MGRIATLAAVGLYDELFLLVEDGLGGKRPLHGTRSAVETTPSASGSGS